MNESEYLSLREIAWRRPLNADEKARLQSYLVVHPEAQPDWESELVLNQALLSLRGPSVSSNFTARVLHALELEELKERRESPSWLPNIRLWLPRFAVAGLVLGLGGLGYQKYHLNQMQQRAESVKIMTQLATTLPDVQMWKDFDAIAGLDQAGPSQDQILWAALTAE
jgi:hypothetical protein